MNSLFFVQLSNAFEFQYNEKFTRFNWLKDFCSMILSSILMKVGENRLFVGKKLTESATIPKLKA